MTNTFTLSSTSTFTRTHAAYLASKVAADLLQMQLFYGRPFDNEINQYLEEAIILILKGYLDFVEYGFKRNDNRVVSLKYVVRADGMIQTDDRSGRVVPGVDISGAYWYSFLSKNLAFSLLPWEEQQRVEQSLPIERSSGDPPGNGNGCWTNDKAYSTNGIGVQRSTFRSF